MMLDMDTAVIVAIIGAAATVVASFVSVRRETKQFRQESNDQHGLLLSYVETIRDRTDDIAVAVKTVSNNLDAHIADHAINAESPPPAAPKKKVPARKPK